MHRRMVHLIVLAIVAGSVLTASLARAAVYSPLAVRVSQAGIVTVTDAQLAAAGWPLPLVRDHVTLSRCGQTVPLTDTGSGFAFLGLPSESRWSREAVYWFAVSDTPAPRAQLPNRL